MIKSFSDLAEIEISRIVPIIAKKRRTDVWSCDNARKAKVWKKSVMQRCMKKRFNNTETNETLSR